MHRKIATEGKYYNNLGGRKMSTLIFHDKMFEGKRKLDTKESLFPLSYYSKN